VHERLDNDQQYAWEPTRRSSIIVTGFGTLITLAVRSMCAAPEIAGLYPFGKLGAAAEVAEWIRRGASGCEHRGVRGIRGAAWRQCRHKDGQSRGLGRGRGVVQRIGTARSRDPDPRRQQCPEAEVQRRLPDEVVIT